MNGMIHSVVTCQNMPTLCNKPASAPRGSRTKNVVALAKRAGGPLRSRDLTGRGGITRTALARLCARGLLRQVGRGLYVHPSAEPTENRSLAEAARRVPAGVVCLLSALRFHGLTTQLPHEVWLAIDRKARAPRGGETMVLRVVRFSGRARTEGVETHTVEGVPVRVYSPAKTVADLFKYRHKLGRDVALEALRDCWQQRRATMDELWHFAEVCRVTRTMAPYLEMLP